MRSLTVLSAKQRKLNLNLSWVWHQRLGERTLDFQREPWYSEYMSLFDDPITDDVEQPEEKSKNEWKLWLMMPFLILFSPIIALFDDFVLKSPTPTREGAERSPW